MARAFRKLRCKLVEMDIQQKELADRLGVPLVAVAHNAKYKLIGRADAIFSITAAQCPVFTAGGYPEDKIFHI